MLQGQRQHFLVSSFGIVSVWKLRAGCRVFGTRQGWATSGFLGGTGFFLGELRPINHSLSLQQLLFRRPHPAPWEPQLRSTSLLVASLSFSSCKRPCCPESWNGELLSRQSREPAHSKRTKTLVPDWPCIDAMSRHQVLFIRRIACGLGVAGWACCAGGGRRQADWEGVLSSVLG